MTTLLVVLVALPPMLFVYAYFGYPLVLRMLGAGRGREPGFSGKSQDPELPVSDWPSVSISLPAYNEEARLSGTLDALLALDYPKDLLEIVVVSVSGNDSTRASCVCATPTLEIVTVAPVLSPSVRAKPLLPAGSPVWFKSRTAVTPRE